MKSRLKELRLKHGLTQKEVAAFLGVDRTTYSYYENEKIGIRIGYCIKLAQLYGTTLDYLLGKTGNSK